MAQNRVSSCIELSQISDEPSDILLAAIYVEGQCLQTLVNAVPCLC